MYLWELRNDLGKKSGLVRFRYFRYIAYLITLQYEMCKQFTVNSSLFCVCHCFGEGSVNARERSCECESESLRDFVKPYGYMPFLCVSFERVAGRVF